MRLTTPLLGAAVGGALALATKNDPWKYVVWGGGVGLLVTILGGASAGLGGISLRVGAAPGHAGPRGPVGPKGAMGQRGAPGLPGGPGFGGLPGYGGYEGAGPYAYGDFGMGGYAGIGGPYEGGVDWGYDW